VIPEADGSEVLCPARIAMVPFSSVVTSVRTIDRPRPVARFNSKPGSRPRPSLITRMRN
jgi:hypothetical protein